MDARYEGTIIAFTFFAASVKLVLVDSQTSRDRGDTA
jgi:hypothetical protein